ncbi:unnamed protein product [Ectocarpus sp. 4 AP-2014]
MKSLHAESFLGSWEVPVCNLDLTGSGRQVHHEGVAQLRKSIASNGWLDTRIIACRSGGEEDVFDESKAKTATLRVIDGRHRCTALALNDKESGRTTSVIVEVNRAVDMETERVIAASDVQNVAEAVVKTALCDRIVAHKAALHQQEKCRNSTSKPIAVEEFAGGSCDPRENPKVQAKDLVASATQALKQEGLSALMDVTYLPERPSKHRDLQPSPDGLHFERVTLKALLRPEFAAMPGEEQAAYVYRMASGFKIGNLTEEDFRELDGAAGVIGRVLRSVDALVAQRDWTAGFLDFVRGVMAYEPYSQMISHHLALDEACATYTRSLPDGMLPHKPLTAFLRGRPWQPILLEMGKYKSMEAFPESHIRKEKELREESAAEVAQFNQAVIKRRHASTTKASAAALGPATGRDEVADGMIAVKRLTTSRLLAIDVFCRDSVGDLHVLRPAGIKYMLAFVNFSDLVSLTPGDPTSCTLNESGLQTVLDLLAKNLDNRGTVVLSVPSATQRSDGLADMFKSAGLRTQQLPVTSLYARRQTRERSSSITLIAHKDGERFICNNGDAESDSESASARTPRASTPIHVRPHGDAAVEPCAGRLSSRKPAEGSYISSELTKFFIERFTDRGDGVLTTDAAVDTTVCSTTLHLGRTLVALVPDLCKVGLVRQSLGEWEERSRSEPPRVMVSKDTRPINVPHSNVPRSVADQVASREPLNTPRVISPEQQVAAIAADKMGLEVKPSHRHGVGLFAKEDMAAGDATPMACFGSYVVYESLPEVVSAINKDGAPRHHVAGDVWMLCTGEEKCRPQAALFMVPHQSCLLWYMNSSGSDENDANVVAHVELSVGQLSLGREGRVHAEILDVIGTAFEELLVPSKVLVFRLSKDVKAGDELLHDYYYELVSRDTWLARFSVSVLPVGAHIWYKALDEESVVNECF